MLRGRNERTRAYLFTMADGAKQAIDHPVVMALGADVTDGDLRDLNQLQQAADAAVERVQVQCKALAQGKDLTLWKLLEAEAKRIEGAS
jgi:BioD-like phosphotransacetylase family protein